MTTQALENAKRRREVLAAERNKALALADELKRRLNRVDQFILDYDAFEADLDPVDIPSAGLAAAPIPIAEATQTPPPAAAKPPRNSKKEDVADAARRIIAAEGKPVMRPDLLRLILSEGFVIGGGAPETVLSTMLWRTKASHKVIHLRNVGYWLAERDWPPALYSAEDDSFIGVEDDPPPDAEDDFTDNDGDPVLRGQ